MSMSIPNLIKIEFEPKYTNRRPIAFGLHICICTHNSLISTAYNTHCNPYNYVPLRILTCDSHTISPKLQIANRLYVNSGDLEKTGL